MDLILNGNVRDLGGFSVVRSIPQAKRRHVGPFVFLDHMGPMEIDSTHLLDVRPHPHIGLATVTYLFEGRGRHRDSLGSDQVIYPGDLNWMTAGKGIVHSERTPKEDINPDLHKKIHGIQIWVGLPVEHEEEEPSFVHYAKELFPSVKTSGLNGKLLIGSYEAAVSPVKTFSRTLLMETQSKLPGEEVLSFREKEIGIFLIHGELAVNDQELKKDDLIVVADPSQIKLTYGADTRIVFIGGEPFPEPRYIWWNFVSSRKERIREAAERWKAQDFGKVPGEIDFIPLPDIPLP